MTSSSILEMQRSEWPETLILCLVFTTPSGIWYASACTYSKDARLEMDKTTAGLTAPRNGRRSCKREIRIGCRKRAFTPPTHSPSSAGQTTSVHKNGSHPPGTSCTSSSYLEASALSRPGRRRSCAGTVKAFVSSGRTNQRYLLANQGERQRPSPYSKTWPRTIDCGELNAFAVHYSS